MAKFEDIAEDLKNYELLVFDFDGTLVDLNINWDILKKSLQDFCFKEKNEKIDFTFLNRGLIEARKKFGGKFYNRLLEKCSRYEMDDKKYVLNVNLINYLNVNNKRTAIYSMNTRKCIDNFIKNNLIKVPELIISRETSFEFKPSGKDLLNILKKFNLNSSKVAFIGNSEEDLLSGKAAGVKTFIISI